MSDTIKGESVDKVIVPLSPVQYEEMLSVLESIDAKLTALLGFFERWAPMIDKLMAKYRRWWL